MWQAVPMNPLLRTTFFSLLLGMLWTPSAGAWGNVGHRITGIIAASLLSHSAEQQVQQLLGEEPLSVAATYMDTQRATLAKQWPQAEKWHYDNQSVCQQVPYCTDGHCATRQIERFRTLLADRNAPRSERALALRLLIHMLGDIHQPLHLADNADRGGNNLHVRLYTGGSRYSLHEVMDTVLLKQLQGNKSITAYTAQLQAQYRNQIRQWQQGDIKTWANEAHTLATERLYGQLPGFVCHSPITATLTLPENYVQSAKHYLPEQLTKAGARIAWVLNNTFQ